MKKILINSESRNTAIRLIPVAKALMASDYYIPECYSSLTSAGGPSKGRELKCIFEKEGLPLLTNEDYGLPALEAEISKSAQEYHSQFSASPKIQRSIANLLYKDIPVFKYAGQFILDWNVQKITWISWFQEIIRKTKPDLVVNGYDLGGIKKYFTIAAKSNHVPVLSLQYAFHNKERLTKRTADYFCIWGDYFIESFVNSGVDPKNIFVTGLPSLDSYLTKPFNRNEFLTYLGLHPQKSTILLGISDQQVYKTVDAVMEELTNRQDAQVIFKFHPDFPDADRKIYEHIATEHGISFLIIKNEQCDSINIIQASDVIISTPSSILTEALAFDVPSILIAYTETGQNIPYSARELANYFYSSNNIKETVLHIKMILNSDKPFKLTDTMKKYRDSSLGTLDGRASERIVETINQVLIRN